MNIFDLDCSTIFYSTFPVSPQNTKQFRPLHSISNFYDIFYILNYENNKKIIIRFKVIFFICTKNYAAPNNFFCLSLPLLIISRWCTYNWFTFAKNSTLWIKSNYITITFPTTIIYIMTYLLKLDTGINTCFSSWFKITSNMIKDYLGK